MVRTLGSATLVLALTSVGCATTGQVQTAAGEVVSAASATAAATAGATLYNSAGDLPNLSVGALGFTAVDVTTSRLTLESTSGTGVFDADGTAVIVHRGEDDQKTDPSGNSGARIACGVVRPL